MVIWTPWLIKYVHYWLHGLLKKDAIKQYRQTESRQTENNPRTEKMITEAPQITITTEWRWKESILIIEISLCALLPTKKLWGYIYWIQIIKIILFHRKHLPKQFLYFERPHNYFLKNINNSHLIILFLPSNGSFLEYTQKQINLNYSFWIWKVIPFNIFL